MEKIKMENEKSTIKVFLNKYLNICSKHLSNFPLKLLFFILLFTPSVNAYSLTSSELNSIVLTQLNQEAKKQFKDKDYKITISNIPNTIINTSESIKPKIEIINPNSTNSLNSFRKIIVKNSKNNIVKVIPINVQIKLYENVLVAINPISYGEEINSNNTQLIKKEVSKIYGKTYSKLENNLVASRNILKGNIIQKNSVKQKAIIARNSIVDIVFLSNNGLKISLKGKALKEGSLGEKILVKSDKYNKIYSAIIQDEQSVIVKI